MAFNKEKVMDAARKLVDKGQVDKAIKEYLRVVREDPQDVRVWLKIGDLHAKKGQKAEATETYLKVARFYQDQGFFTKAVAVFKQILKLDPRLVEVHLKLAELYRQLGLMSDAMVHFESVATHFHREGKTKEALDTIRQLVELDPQNVATRIKLAELYSKEGMVDDAVAEFGVVCDQMRRQGRQDDFIKVAERLLWHRPEHRELNRELAALYLQRNDPRRALQKLQVCFKADPRDVETLALLAAAFQALEQKGKTVSVLKELARILDETKQRAKAEDVYRKILVIAPGDADATAYLAAGRPTAPSPPPVAAPARAPDPRARFNFTDNLPALRTGDPRMTGAQPLLDARALDDRFELPDDDGGGAAAHEGRSPPPMSAPARAAQGSADFAADLELDAARPPRASSSSAGEEHAEEIAKILTETDVYVKYGLHQKAVDHLRRVFAIDPDNLDAHERLRDVYLAQGREPEAIAELLRLVELTARVDPSQAEQCVREILALDGANHAALELARRHNLDLSLAPEVEVIDGGQPELELDLPVGLAPIDDELELLDVGERRRSDGFDQVDPTLFDPTLGGGIGGGGGSAPTLGPRAASAGPARVTFDTPSPTAQTDATRQVAMAEVERLVARSRAPSGPSDVALGSPLPFRTPSIGGAGHDSSIPPRPVDVAAMGDAIDASLEDPGDDIDQGVASALRDAADEPLADALAPGRVGAGPDDPSWATAVGHAPDLPLGDELDDDLPFDPAAAREFDRHMGASSQDATAAADEPEYAAEPAAAAEEPAYATEVPVYGGAPFDVATQLSPLPDTGGAVYDSTYQPPADDGAFPDERTAYVEGNALAEQHFGGGGAPPEDDRDVFDPSLPSFTAVGASRSLEDELEDADDYAGRGHLASALSILRGLQVRFPRHPLVSARVRDLELQLGLASPDTNGTQTVDPADLEEVDPEELDSDDDVAAALGRQHGGPDSAALGHARPHVVLAHSVEDSDADTHFDLGLAYKEMGLYDDAIKAFDKVISSPTREVQSRMMVGLCYRERGDLGEAVHHFKAGLHASTITERERQTLLYEIGATYEGLGDLGEAAYYFDMVVKRDPTFLDALARLEQIRGQHGR